MRSLDKPLNFDGGSPGVSFFDSGVSLLTVDVLEVDVLDESDDAPRIPPRVPVVTTKISGTNQAMPMTMAHVAFAELTPRRFA